MWMTGTLINVAAVLLGASIGTLIGERLPDRFRQTVMHAVGLMTLLIGFQMALGTQSAILVLISLLLGGLAGEAAQLDGKLTAFGDWVQATIGSKRATAGNGRKRAPLISQGFVTASLVFCVGPMAILGSFQDGLTGVYDTLAVKSVLDGFTAIALASSLGWGVTLSSLTVLAYQGTLTASASWAKPFLTDPVMAEMTATGGLLIVAIGLNLLGITRIRVANLLPALVIAPILTILSGQG
jgi:uncharacterized protein